MICNHVNPVLSVIKMKKCLEAKEETERRQQLMPTSMNIHWRKKSVQENQIVRKSNILIWSLVGKREVAGKGLKVKVIIALVDHP